MHADDEPPSGSSGVICERLCKNGCYYGISYDTKDLDYEVLCLSTFRLRCGTVHSL